jgi:uncharacterized protein (DUF58 family)
MLISKELLAKIKKIQIKTDRMATEILSGEYKTAFRGKGLNFDNIREYQMGDDIRLIDWKVTARMQEAFVRQYKEERQLSIVIIIDLSASNDFGTQKQNKRELSIELASVLASLAIKSNDKVGMMLVSDEIESYIPPKQGRAHIFRLIKDLLTFKAKSPKTNLQAVLKEALGLIPRHSVVFLLSDFIDGNTDDFGYEKELRLLNKSCDLIAISIRDPRELELPNIGYVQILNPETGKRDLLNLNRKHTRDIFMHSQGEMIFELKTKFKKLGIDLLELQTNRPYIQSLLHLFLVRHANNIRH